MCAVEPDRERDIRLLNAAADGMAELANMELADGLNAEDFRSYCRVKIAAAEALVTVLERRSKLLGLDAPVATGKATDGGAGGQDGAIVAAIRDEAQKPRLVK
jgi:hypothetical protein